MRKTSLGIAALLAATIATPAFASIATYTIAGTGSGFRNTTFPFSHVAFSLTGTGDTANITNPISDTWQLSLSNVTLTLGGVSNSVIGSSGIFGNSSYPGFGFQYYEDYLDVKTVSIPASSPDYALATNFGPTAATFDYGATFSITGGLIKFISAVDVTVAVSGLPSTVPEPASMALLGAGLLGLGFARRRG